MISRSSRQWLFLMSIVTASAFLLTSGSAYAPFDRGNGGDRANLLDDAAWFIAPNRTIKTCAEFDADFGTTRKDATDHLLKAIETWRVYIDKRGHAFTHQPTVKFDLRFACTGDEDLVVYFGVNNQQVLSAKSSYNDPLAFAHRDAYDEAAGWGRGFIWISAPDRTDDFGPIPNWAVPNALLGILLHELGHVFGVPHIPGTIMTADIDSLVKHSRTNPAYAKRLKAIDHEVSLLPLRLLDEAVEGTLQVDACEAPLQSTAVDLFANFVGRQPSGRVRLRLKKVSEQVLFDGLSRQDKYSLTFKDDVGSKDVTISSRGVRSVLEANASQDVFRSVRRGPGVTGADTLLLQTSSSDPSRIFLASALDNSGAVQSLLIAFNMQDFFSGGRQIMILTTKDNILQKLYSSLLPDEVEACGF